jgi:hypothetical protein
MRHERRTIATTDPSASVSNWWLWIGVVRTGVVSDAAEDFARSLGGGLRRVRFRIVVVDYFEGFDNEASSVFSVANFSRRLVRRRSYFAMRASALTMRALTRSSFVGLVAEVLTGEVFFFICISSERVGRHTRAPLLTCRVLMWRGHRETEQNS